MNDLYSFTGNPNTQPEIVKDTDLTHDSPHHTLGGGATQAAAGNHKHSVDDLSDFTPSNALGLSNTIPIANTGTGAAGTGPTASRGDHAHPAIAGLSLSNTIPATDGGSGGAGAATAAARGDHQHPAHNAAFATNADMVDNKHATDFAPVTHTHTGAQITTAVANSGALDGHDSTYFSPSTHKHSGADITSGTVPRARLPLKIGRTGPYAIGADQSTGNISVTHGLGSTPVACFVSADDDGGDCTVFASVESFNGTTLVAQMRNIGNAEAGVYLNWIVFS